LGDGSVKVLRIQVFDKLARRVINAEVVFPWGRWILHINGNGTFNRMHGVLRDIEDIGHQRRCC
jgi:hypothetical protein